MGPVLTRKSTTENQPATLIIIIVFIFRLIFTLCRRSAVGSEIVETRVFQPLVQSQVVRFGIRHLQHT